MEAFKWNLRKILEQTTRQLHTPFCHLLIYFVFKINFFCKNSSRNTIRMSNILDPDQARRFVRHDLDPNCLQRLSADDPSTQKG